MFWVCFVVVLVFSLFDFLMSEAYFNAAHQLIVSSASS